MKRARTIFILSLFLLAGIMAGAQTHRTANTCGVTAVIDPGIDSIVTTNTIVLFISASTGATDYQFIIDGSAFSPNQAINYVFPVGLTEVKLIAWNGSCRDTAYCYYFYPGTFPTDANNTKMFYGIAQSNQYVRHLLTVSSGGYLLAADRDNNAWQNIPRRGYLIRTKESGCIEWSRMIESTLMSNIELTEEATDGGFFVIGKTEADIPFILKLDAMGNHVWSRKINSANGIINFFPYGMKAMSDGGLVVTGRVGDTLIVIRLNSNGNIIWQKKHNHANVFSSSVNQILQKDDALYIGGSIHYIENNNPIYAAILLKLNYATGQTTWTKRYNAPGIAAIYGLHNADQRIMVNTYLPTPAGTYSIGGMMKIDTSGFIYNANVITQTDEYYSLSMRYVPLPDKGYYLLSSGFKPLPLQPGISYQTKFMRLDSNFNILWARHYAAVNLGQFFYPSLGPDKTLVMAGHENGQGLSYWNSYSSKVMLKKIDSTGDSDDPQLNCGFHPWPMTRYPVNSITQEPFVWAIDAPSNHLSQSFPVTVVDFYPEMRYKCPDYVDSCGFLKVTGPGSICNLSDTYLYKIHKNKGCGQPTNWRVPAGVTIVNQTDTTVTLQFPDFGNYVIGATLDFGCSPLKDSVTVAATPKTSPLNLGPDDAICPGNTKILHAGPAFLNYLWQDGTTDSLFTVSNAGLYWVQTVDSCGNIKRDSITISLAPSVPLSIGPDRTKCNNDTLHLNAPAAFINYAWSPGYNINTTNAQNVVVQPAIDTVYTLIAEKTPGCFAYDTIRITVWHSPVVDLGADASFCQGDSALLDAGAIFTEYLWSNGVTLPQQYVHASGTYTFIGTTAEGCRSYDTLRITNVFALPAINLNPDPTLCIGDTRLLDAGPGFASYLWNNGHTGRSITVSGTGLYAISVIDNNDCEAADTTIITTMLALPSGFLAADTAICSYGTLQLQASGSFNQYLWSNGSTTPTITISGPGTYSLQVRNNSNCLGKDTIIVNPKECLKGLYVPKGFTPNGDGKNDIFRPLLFGNIRQYRFMVYNRWGQIIFQSSAPGAGWNGNVGGVKSDSGVFVWTCTYQLEGEAVKMERGSMVLIR